MAQINYSHANAVRASVACLLAGSISAEDMAVETARIEGLKAEWDNWTNYQAPGAWTPGVLSD